MVAALNQRKNPLGLVVTGEAESWQPALEMIVGPQWLRTYHVGSDRELLDVVESGVADAAVLDDAADWRVDALHLLRMIRRLDAALPVVIVTARRDRRWLENALRLEAFSVVVRPLELEELLRQIQRIMIRLDAVLRLGLDER
jgi:DNA-binding NtrC family response regulator